MKDESTVQQECQIQARYDDTHLMRNNSGALKDKEGRVVRYGLGNVSAKHNENFKSSDLIGFKVVTITKDMVGQKIAQFTAVECKEEKWKPTKKLDKREQAQSNFLSWVHQNGGLAGFANSVESLKKILNNK